MQSPQPVDIEDVVEEPEWYVALIPHLGISSFLHLGILMLLYVCGKDFGAIHQVVMERVESVLARSLRA